MAANNQGNIAAPDQHSDKSAGESGENNRNSDADAPLVNRLCLQELVHGFDPTLWLDEDVEEVILYLADEFVESSLTNACRIAKNRGSKTVEVKDMQMHLKKKWNITVPYFGDCVKELTPEQRSAMTEAHLQTLARMRNIFEPK